MGSQFHSNHLTNFLYSVLNNDVNLNPTEQLQDTVAPR